MMVWRKNLASVLVELLLVLVGGSRNFFLGVGREDVKTSPVRDGNLLQIVHVEGNTARADGYDHSSIVSPDVLCSVDWSDIAPCLLLGSAALEFWVLRAGLERTISSGLPGKDAGEGT